MFCCQKIYYKKMITIGLGGSGNKEGGEEIRLSRVYTLNLVFIPYINLHRTPPSSSTILKDSFTISASVSYLKIYPSSSSFCKSFSSSLFLPYLLGFCASHESQSSTSFHHRLCSVNLRLRPLTTFPGVSSNGVQIMSGIFRFSGMLFNFLAEF